MSVVYCRYIKKILRDQMKYKFALFSLLFLYISAVFAAVQPLPADQAFQFSATAKDYQTILVQFKIAPNYYLYQKHFHFKVIKPDNVALGNPLYPSNIETLKTNLGIFDVYAHALTIPIPIIDATEKNIVLQVHYQGCSKAGYCYPPTTKIVEINLVGNYLQPATELKIDVAPIIQAASQNKFENLLTSHSLFLVITGFFVFGLLLSLTPCVLPMIPILSIMIIGKEKSHAFLLSLFYVLGMAITYAIAGIFFGVVGSNVQALFQQPWIIICFSILFILMALSLFGLFNLQLPEKWRSKIAAMSYHQKSGTYFGAAVMGILSTLILSPCVTPPLVAALGFISQSGNAALGGIALFAMGIGMGAPLLLIGALGSRILPKSGAWMNAVKYFLGILLLLVALFMLQRVFPEINLFRVFSEEQSTSVLVFKNVNSVAEINKELNSANNKIVMLDFSADWCVACKELDVLTFQNPAVQKQLKQFILLRADVTKNTIEDQVLEKYYNVIAPPTILFFKNNQEIQNSRIIGALSAEQFLKHINFGAVK